MKRRSYYIAVLLLAVSVVGMTGCGADRSLPETGAEISKTELTEERASGAEISERELAEERASEAEPSEAGASEPTEQGLSEAADAVRKDPIESAAYTETGSYDCGVAGCTQTGEHRHSVCEDADCTETALHEHDGVWYCEHCADDGHAYHTCGVEGCAVAEAHMHGTCGVEGCTRTGTHSHEEAGHHSDSGHHSENGHHR